MSFKVGDRVFYIGFIYRSPKVGIAYEIAAISVVGEIRISNFNLFYPTADFILATPLNEALS
jgi:hypothetical protein